MIRLWQAGKLEEAHKSLSVEGVFYPVFQAPSAQSAVDGSHISLTSGARAASVWGRLCCQVCRDLCSQCTPRHAQCHSLTSSQASVAAGVAWGSGSSRKILLCHIWNLALSNSSLCTVFCFINCKLIINCKSKDRKSVV